MTTSADFREFEITLAEIERRRFVGQATTDIQRWDVLPALAEVNLFESIWEPAMTGRVAIVDSSSLAAAINFQGQEVLRLEWRVGEKQYVRNFYIYSVSSQNKSTTTTSSTLVLDIIERHGYFSKFQRLDGTKAGEIGDIVDAILTGIDAALTTADTSVQRIRIMENNRHPLDIVRWLSERATNDIGEPMFTYSTLNKNSDENSLETPNVKFRDLGGMLSDHPWEAEETFVYTLTPAPSTEDAFTRDRYRIQSVSFPENDNIFQLSDSGALRSTYYNLDLTNRTQDAVEFNAETHFDNRQGSGSASEDHHTMFDDHFSLTNEDAETRVAGLDSFFASGINTTSVFDGYRGYNEETQYDNHQFRLSRESDILMLERERYSIMVDGYHFGATDNDRGVGTTINVRIPKDQPVYTDEANSLDLKRSGKFLIMNVRHVMNNTNNQYSVVLEIGRPDTPDDINDSGRYETEAEQRPR